MTNAYLVVPKFCAGRPRGEPEPNEASVSTQEEPIDERFLKERGNKPPGVRGRPLCLIPRSLSSAYAYTWEGSRTETATLWVDIPGQRVLIRGVTSVFDPYPSEYKYKFLLRGDQVHRIQLTLTRTCYDLQCTRYRKRHT